MAGISSQCCFCGFVILICVLQVVHASWWYLGVASSYQVISEEVVHEPEGTSESVNLNVLTHNQLQFLRHDPMLLQVISKGASMGINECQHQFKERRWNCTTFNDTSVFGNVLGIKSRETAYIYAISSAGITYSVTRACASGELEGCGCDNRVKQFQQQPGAKFQWGGCSDNIRYGSRFSKKFLDVAEAEKKDQGSMNIWNNGAGRKTIKDEMIKVCKCHGISGDCSVRVCWKKMHSFRGIGAALRRKFDGASYVRWDKKKAKLKRTSGLHKKPTKKDLVYLAKSPDFCEPNLDSGSLGTRGRQCNKTSYGLDGCDLMCCGRGYQTLLYKEESDCDCKFHWCCRVECTKCKHLIEVHYCN